MFQNGQTHFKNLGANAANAFDMLDRIRFLKSTFYIVASFHWLKDFLFLQRQIMILNLI